MKYRTTLTHNDLQKILWNLMELAGPQGLDTHAEEEQGVAEAFAHDLLTAAHGGLMGLGIMRLHGEARFYVLEALREHQECDTLTLAIQEMLHEGVISFHLTPERGYLDGKDGQQLHTYTIYPVPQA